MVVICCLFITDFSLSTLSPAQVPNLGIVVYQLKQCTNHFMMVYENRKQHLSKLEGLSDLSVEDLKQVTTIKLMNKAQLRERQHVALQTSGLYLEVTFFVKEGLLKSIYLQGGLYSQVAFNTG